MTKHSPAAAHFRGSTVSFALIPAVSQVAKAKLASMIKTDVAGH